MPATLPGFVEWYPWPSSESFVLLYITVSFQIVKEIPTYHKSDPFHNNEQSHNSLELGQHQQPEYSHIMGRVRLEYWAKISIDTDGNTVTSPVIGGS